jgi:hypothetical protein
LGGPFWLTLQSFHQSTLWDLLVPEEGGNRDSPLEGGKFEPLVEIVNSIPEGALSLRDYEKRVTEVEVSPRAVQRPGRIAL